MEKLQHRGKGEEVDVVERNSAISGDFQTDSDSATLNPLYIEKKSADASSSVDDDNDNVVKKIDFKKRWYLSIGTRAVFFLILPIVLILSFFKDENGYTILWSYIWIGYIVIFQFVLVLSVVDEKSKKKQQSMKIMAGLIALPVTLTIGVHMIPDTKNKVETYYSSEPDYKSCTLFKKTTLPLFCRLYFLNKDEMYATPTRFNGEHLSLQTVELVMTLFQVGLTNNNRMENSNSQCDTLVYGILCQSVLTPCDTSCEPSKLSKDQCTKHITSCTPTSTNTFYIQEVLSKLDSINILTDKSENKLLIQLLNRTATDLLRAATLNYLLRNIF